MSIVGLPLFAVMLLTDPSEIIDAEAAALVSADADRVEVVSRDGSPTARKSARITSMTSDFDRKQGVALFEGNVKVVYSDDYTMCSDALYAFLSGSNELSRVVAVGHVVITNETRVGTCAMATYRRRKSEIEMFGDGGNAPAHLIETGDDASELEGSRIRFWLDSEQVEVENSRITVEEEGNKKLL